MLESGGEVAQETRGWSEAEQRTFSQRSKEYAQDYRYFPEPDLPSLDLDPAWVEELRASLPELPAARRARLVERHGISEYDAEQLTQEVATADLFESTVAAGAPAKPVANWIIGTQPMLGAAGLAELVNLVVSGAINRDQGLQVLEEARTSGRPPGEIVRERGLSQVSDELELEGVVDRVIAENPQVVADYLAGKERAIGPLIGKVGAATRGRANPAVVNRMLRSRITSLRPE